MELKLFISPSVADPHLIAEHARAFLSLELVVHTGHFGAKWIKSQQETCLIHDGSGFSLVVYGRTLSPDWQKKARRVVKAGRKTEGLLRALKLSPGMQIIDATAGLGIDSLLMASAGAEVTLIEKHPILALMLSDQMRQIQNSANWRSIAPKLSLIHGDAMTVLDQLARRVDVIYLDPMFESESYRAKVSGQIQLLHSLAGPPSLDEQHALLQAAMKLADKVVVKRATGAPSLAGQIPQAISQGDSVRYDIYTLKP